MLRNLRQRDCPLRGLEACPTPADQKLRFLEAGWKGATALDMNTVYAQLPSDERARIERIEMLDEFEEWHLINSHYCVAWAWKGGGGAVADDGNEPLSSVALI